MDMTLDLNKLRKCKKRAEEKSDLKEVGNICNALGELLSQYGHHEEAIAEHQMEKHVSKAFNDKIGEAIASRKIGECYCKLGQFDKALKLQNQYLALALECSDKVETQRALATLGNTYYTQADAQGAETSRYLLDQAEKKFLLALRTCEELRSASSLTESELMAMKGRLLLNLGLVYDSRGAEKDSRDYLQQALTIAQQWRLEEEEYLCHFNRANQALQRGQSVLAQQSLQQALAIATRLHDKPRQKEVFCQLAVANVCAGDVKSAKHFLKKAYKFLPTPGEGAKIIKLFRAVNTVGELREKLAACGELREKLAACGEGDKEELFHVHEKLGDAFTDIGSYCGSYAQAIKHYQHMVDCGESIGLSADKLIPAYVSLAQTYADNRQPDLAISNYHKELQLRGDDHEQMGRTWLNIAELQERQGVGYKVLSKSYMSAFTHAKKADHPTLQVRVLRSLIATQVAFKEHRHKMQTEAKLQQVKVKYGLRSSEDSSEDEDDSQPPDSDVVPASEPESDLSISDLTDSDKSDEENVRPVLSQSVGTSRVRRQKMFKKNEKGETPLHVACINGNLKRVRSLLAEGHPVNVRDHCGWTPLHEAANHDFPDIVEALLDAGADINDRGGAECNGFTALIDSAASGNVAVMKILIERGASVLAKDDSGTTALQALRNWHRDYGDDLSQDSCSEYNDVLHLLQEKTAGCTKSDTTGSRVGVGGSVASSSLSLHGNPARLTGSPSCSAQPAARVTPSHSSQTVSANPRPAETLSSEGEEEGGLYQNPQLEDIAASSQTATEAYRTSILALGSSAQRAVVRATTTTTTKPASSSQPGRRDPRPALIAAGEAVGDDWLIEDVQPTGHKRRDHSSVDGILSSDSIRTARGNKRARLSNLRRHVERDSDSDSGSRASGREEALLENPSAQGNTSSPSLDHSGSQNLDQVAARRLASDSEEDDFLPVLNSVRRSVSAERLTDIMRVSEHSGREEGELGRLTHRRTEGEGERNFHGAGLCVDASQQQPPTVAVPVPAHPARVKVKIEGAVFLIPIPAVEQKTVGWLSEEASQRYSGHFGRRPLLTLSSSDGAILSTEDVLSTVLSSDEQLEASVLGWDEPAMSERYAQACKTLATVKYRNISGLLREAETSNALCLSGLGLHSAVLLPISRALRGQVLLQQLHLPDNHVGDSGLEGLVTALGDLQGLTVLNLAGNNITTTGLRRFAALFNTQPHNTDPPLPLLESLDLSHNPLGSNIADSLCYIVKGLPSLTSLSLSSCHLTAALFQHNRPALAACLQGSRLQHLDVSHNNLGTLGVELLLRSINSHTITALDLGHTRSDPSPGHLTRHLRAFIGQGCALRDLSLENCCIHQEDLEFLCRLPIELPGLQRLNICVNKVVTTDTVQRLLSNSARCPDSHLHRLDAQSCSVTSPLSLPSSSSATLMESLKDKLTAPHALQHLALTCGRLDKADKEALTEAWTQRWVEVSVQFCGQSVLLALKQPG